MVFAFQDLQAFNSSSNFMALLYLFILLPYLYHQINFSLAFNLQYYETIGMLGAYSIQNMVPKDLAVFGYIIVSISGLLSLISMFFNSLDSTGFMYILAWIGNKLFPYLRFLIEINTVLAAFFMLLDDYLFIFFGLTTVINLFAALFLENFLLEKDYLKCGNRTFNLVWKIILFINLSINKAGMMFQSESLYNTLISLRFIASWILWILYLKTGFDIYQHQNVKYFFMVIVTLFSTLSTGQFLDQILYLLKLHDNVYDLGFAAIIFIPLLAITIAAGRMRVWTVFDNIKEKIKTKAFYLKHWTDDESLVGQCFFRGLIVNHNISQCPNTECYSHHDAPFDSKRNKSCELNKIMTHKHSFENFLIKCWYQNNLDEKKISQKIDYAEFLFIRQHKIYRSYHQIQECEKQTLFPFNKLRISRLRHIMKQFSHAVRKELYNSELDIESVTRNQKIFQNIQELILEIISKTLQFWKTVNYHKVNLTHLIQIVTPIFDNIDKVNDGWKDLSTYLDRQKKWKFFYVWYLLYIKNEKLPVVFLQQFSNEVKEKIIFSTESDLENRALQLKFEEREIIVHVNSDVKHSIITNVNSYFTKMLGYDKSEIISYPLQILMTATIANYHSQSFHSWVYNGKCSASQNYHVRKMYLKHKNNSLVGANKYLKPVLAADNQLEYIALFKILSEEQNVVIVDQQMNVEGWTLQLQRRLGLICQVVSQESALIQNNCINLLLLAPCLLKFAVFEQIISKQSKTQFYNKYGFIQEPKNNVKHVGVKTRQSHNKIRYLKHNQEESNQIKIKTSLVIPNDILQLNQLLVKQQYHSKSRKQKFQLLSQILGMIHKNTIKNNLTCQILIKPKMILTQKYYQIDFISITNLEHPQNNIMLQSKNTRRQSIDVETSNFHRHFEKNFDHFYSLEAAQNIFIKQENNSPVCKLFHIELLRNMLRSVFFSISVISLVSFLSNTFYNFNQYVEISQQIIVINNLDLHFFELESSLYYINYYNLNQLQPHSHTPQFYTSALEAFNDAFTDILIFKQNNYLKKCLFNPQTNPTLAFTETITFQNRTDVVTYDEIDLIYKFIQSVQQLEATGFRNYSFARSRQSIFFEYFLVPSFDSLVQNIKMSLNQFADGVIRQIETIVILTYVAQAVILIIGFTLAVLRITSIIQCFMVLLKVFTQFHITQIEKVTKYCVSLLRIFKRLVRKHKQQLSILSNTDEDENVSLLQSKEYLFNHNTFQSENNNISKNKKIKQIDIGIMFTKVSVQTYGLIIFSFLLFAGGYFFINTTIKNNNSSLGKLYEMGYHHFNYYSTVARIQLAIGRKYYNSTLYSQRFSSYFQAEIQQLQALKNKDMRIDPQNFNFEFITLYNKALKENVCELMLTDPIKISECQLTCKTAFKYGIQSFIFFYANDAIGYLRGTVSLSQGDIIQFQKGVRLLNRFLEMLSQEWIEDVKDTVKQYNIVTLQYTIAITFGVLAFYFVFGQLFIVRNLNSQYKTMRKVYYNFMPEYLITKQKIVKAELIQTGILNK